MSEIDPGYTFVDGESCTAAKLNLLVSGATVSGITQDDSTAGVITVSAVPPTAGVGRGWFDTSIGAGRGYLRVYDNGDWKPVAEGFIGYNGSGVSLARGAPVAVDQSFASDSTAGRVAIIRTTFTANTAQFVRMIGVAAETIANGATGVILTRGYASALKDAATVTRFDGIAPSNTANAQATTNNVGSWGNPEGNGYWLDSSAAAAGTEVPCFLHGALARTRVIFKNAGGTVLANAISPVIGTWTTTPTANPSAAPIGTVAHICQMFATNTTAATTLGAVIGLRMTNSTVDIGTGAAHMRAAVLTNAAGANTNAIGAQLIVPETTAASSNTMQYYINSTPTSANWLLTINEVGVIVGGHIA